MPYAVSSDTVRLMSVTSLFHEGSYLHIQDVWRRRLRRMKWGKMRPYDEAINLYAEIVSWHLPAFDPRRPGVAMQRFSGPKFRNSYPAIEERFGYVPKQSRAAFDYLVEHDLITRDVINLPFGRRLEFELIFNSFVRISAPQILRPEDLISADGKGSCQPDDWHDPERVGMLLLSSQMLSLVCNYKFINSEEWLCTLLNEDLMYLVRLLFCMLSNPGDFPKVRNKSGYVRDMISQRTADDVIVLRSSVDREWISASVRALSDNEKYEIDWSFVFD